MVISWPKGSRPDKAPRNQFHHVNDIVPTLYETIGIKAPDEVYGIKQDPMDGVSMAYSFADANVPGRKQTMRCRSPSALHPRPGHALDPCARGYRRPVPHVDVNGARLWVEEAGNGTAVIFVHGGLGDRRLWELQARDLATHFRCVLYDQRFYGHSTGPGEPWSFADDVVGLLDALEIEPAALVGLSFGGRVVLDVALAHPDRVWAVAHVAGAVSGLPVDPYTAEQEAAYETAIEAVILDAAMEVDFAVWAPLGVDETLRELWRATPDVLGTPAGATQLSRPSAESGSRTSPRRRLSSSQRTTRRSSAPSVRSSAAASRAHGSSRSTRTTTCRSESRSRSAGSCANF